MLDLAVTDLVPMPYRMGLIAVVGSLSAIFANLGPIAGEVKPFLDLGLTGVSIFCVWVLWKQNNSDRNKYEARIEAIQLKHANEYFASHANVASALHEMKDAIEEQTTLMKKQSDFDQKVTNEVLQRALNLQERVNHQ